jgi:sorting nexin-41/42
MMYSILLDDSEYTDKGSSSIAHTSDNYGQSPELVPRHPEDTSLSDAESDEEYAAHLRGELAPGKKKGGYNSRIEQILYENPQLPILITDAGKSSESGGKYIVYTIRTGVGQITCIYYLCLQ